MRDRLNSWYQSAYRSAEYYTNVTISAIKDPAKVIEQSASWYESTKKYAHIAWTGTIDTGKMLYSGAKSIVTSEGFTSFAHTTAVEQWQGFAHPLNPDNSGTKFLQRPETRRVLLYGMAAYSWLFSLSTVYDGMMKGTFLRSQPGHESRTEMMLDFMAFSYILGSMFYVSIFSNMAVAKVSAREEPPCEHFKPCECGTGKQLKGMLGSPFYLLVDQLIYIKGIKLLTSQIPLVGPVVGSSAEFLLNSLRTGHVFLEYKAAARGMCTQHRYQLLSKNNNYAFGMGLSYSMLCNLVMWGLKSQLNIGNTGTDNAILSGLFMYYIFSSITIDKPLPGKIAGIDWFWLSRAGTSTTLSYSTRRLGEWLNNPANKKKIEEAKKWLDKFPPYQLLCHLFAHAQQVQSVEDRLTTILTQGAARIYLQYGLDDIKDVVNDIKSIRDSGVHQFVNNYIPYVLSKDTRKLLEILLDNRLEDKLKEIDAYIKRLETELGNNARIAETDYEMLVNFLRAKFHLPTKRQDLTKLLQNDYHPDLRSVQKVTTQPHPIKEGFTPTLLLDVNQSIGIYHHSILHSQPRKKSMLRVAVVDSRTMPSLQSVSSSSTQIMQTLNVQPEKKVAKPVSQPVTMMVQQKQVAAAVQQKAGGPSHDVSSNKRLFVKKQSPF